MKRVIFYQTEKKGSGNVEVIGPLRSSSKLDKLP